MRQRNPSSTWIHRHFARTDVSCLCCPRSGNLSTISPGLSQLLYQRVFKGSLSSAQGTYFTLGFFQVLFGNSYELDQVPFVPHFAKLFKTAFDVYLDILRIVDLRTNTALNPGALGDGPQLICPPPMYQVVDKLRLRLLTADRNQPLRLVDSTFFVGEMFKDEVRLGKEAVSCEYFLTALTMCL
jgi:hypothetical protein